MTTTYILGTAADGPINTPVKVSSREDAKRIFGSIQRESITLSAGDTSKWVEYPIRGNTIECYELTSAYLIRKYRLLGLTKDSDHENKINFSKVPSDIDVVFFYERKPENFDVVLLYEELLQGDPVGDIYLMRLGGAVASVTLTDGATTPVQYITLDSQYGGCRYNAITAVVDAGSTTLTIYPPTGMFYRSKVEYTLSAIKTMKDLAEEINEDTYMGINCILATSQSDSTSSNSLVASTYTLTGGSDGIAVDQDSLYDSTINALDYIKGMNIDLIVCPLPYFIQRAEIYNEGIVASAFDFRTYSSLGAGVSFTIEVLGNLFSGAAATLWALDGVDDDTLWALDGSTESGLWALDSGGALTPVSETLTSNADGTTHYRSTLAIAPGLYNVTVPTTITRSGRTYTFQYWWAYGTYLGDSGLGDTSWPYRTSSNPIQVVVGSKEVQLVAVYDTDSLSPLRTLGTLPGAQTTVTEGQFQTWVEDSYTISAGSPNLGLFASAVKDYCEEGMRVGLMPHFIFPVISRAGDPS